MYSAYILTEASRAKLLEKFVPIFEETILHHITYKFPDTNPPPEINEVKVVGYAANDSIEAFVVSLDGEVRRKDGSFYHITFSLDRLKAKPKDSNNLLKDGWNKIDPITIEVNPKLLK